MSTLSVNNLTTITGSTITIPTGKKLIVTDAGGVQVPHSVVQRVQCGTIADVNNNSPGNWANTGYTLTITPTSNTSTVQITVTAPYRLNGASTYLRGAYRMYRNIGGTDTLIMNTSSDIEMFQVRNAANEHDAVPTYDVMDTPNTTSAVTYRIQSYVHNDTSGGNAGYIMAWGTAKGGNMQLREVRT